MPVNSMSAAFPPQPGNPTDEDRRFLARFALTQRGRPEDFERIRDLTAPAPDITTIARPGEFKGLRAGVIGGGLAGLAAAFELRKLGFDITIFEALEDHIGGRIFTHYFNKEKTLYGELGAMRFPVSHETVWHYINLFGLNTMTFIQRSDNALFYLRGARANTDASGISAKIHIYPRYNLSLRERGMSWQDLIFYGYGRQLLYANADTRMEILQVKPWYNPYTLFWDSRSSRVMLEASGLSGDAINLLTSINPLPGGFLYNSFLDYILEDYPANLTYLYEIIGGAVMLPLAFYKALTDEGPPGAYSAIARECLGRVSWKGGCVVTGIGVSGEDHRATIAYTGKEASDPQRLEFDYVVCAVPFSSLRNVKIEPLFSPIKMQAIREVRYGNFLKAVLLFKRRFWEEGGASRRIIGGVSYTDLPITSIIYPSDHAQTEPEPGPETPGVLTLYSYNPDATRLGNLPADFQYEELLRETEKVHGYAEGFLDKYAAGFKTVSWDNQHWFRGGLCFFAPEQKRLFSYPMALPEYGGRIFFAGEHISANHRWAQGALKSGMEAANGVAAACRACQAHGKRLI